MKETFLQRVHKVHYQGFLSGKRGLGPETNPYANSTSPKTSRLRKEWELGRQEGIPFFQKKKRGNGTPKLRKKRS